MRLATIRHENRPRLCVLADDGGLVPVQAGPADLGAALQQGGVRPGDAVGGGLDPDEVTWLPPVLRPGKILCVALNNAANPGRILSGPGHPALFGKPASCLVGHGQPIRLRPDFGVVHPEPELAVVIGRAGADIPVERAAEHVFGYTVFNDITSPTMRTEDTFHYRAVRVASDGSGDVEHVESWVSYPGRYKGCDTFGPVGPVVVTADEVPDPHDLRIRCSHQGVTVTDDSTRNLRFSVAEVIAFASSYAALEVGDMIAMGTALRPGAGGRPVQSIDLNALGGPVTVTIDGIGTLTNPVVSR